MSMTTWTGASLVSMTVTGYPLTWDDAQEHILRHLGNIAADSPIRLALDEASLTDLNGFLSLMDQELRELEYQLPSTDTDSSPFPMSKLNLGQRKTLQLLSQFLVYIGDHYGSVDLDVIMGLEKAEYQDFCLTKAYYYINMTITPSG